MYIIVPVPISAASLISGTSIAEPDTSRGEVAWVTMTAYPTVGVLRTYQGVVYALVAAVTATATTPPNDPTHWLAKGPTNRMAPFDYYTSTQALGVTSMTYKIKPGYFNSLALYNLLGYQYSISLVDVSGGPVVWSATGFLYEDAVGLYELLFSPIRSVSKLVFTDLPISPTSEITITFTSGNPGEAVGVGMINIGDARSLAGYGDWGGTEYGAESEPTTYSYFQTETDGTVSIVRRHSATNLRATINMPTDQADAAVATLQEVLDRPVSCIGTKDGGYNGLNVFGLISGSMRYDNFSTARLSVTVKGFI